HRGARSGRAGPRRRRPTGRGEPTRRPGLVLTSHRSPRPRPTTRTRPAPSRPTRGRTRRRTRGERPLTAAPEPITDPITDPITNRRNHVGRQQPGRPDHDPERPPPHDLRDLSRPRNRRGIRPRQRPRSETALLPVRGRTPGRVQLGLSGGGSGGV